MPAFKADEEESSPKMEAVDAKTNGVNGHAKTNGVNGDHAKENGVEKKEGGDEEEVGDIYADAVLQCSIENKDACIMCSG